MSYYSLPMHIPHVEGFYAPATKVGSALSEAAVRLSVRPMPLALKRSF